MPICPIGPTCTGCAKCDPSYHTKRAAKRARAASFRAAVPNYDPPLPYGPLPRPTEAIHDKTGVPLPYGPLSSLPAAESSKDFTPPNVYPSLKGRS